MSRPIGPADLTRCVLLDVDGQLALVRVNVDPAKLTDQQRQQLQQLVRELHRGLSDGTHRQ
jgi:hypothetical protein